MTPRSLPSLALALAASAGLALAAQDRPAAPPAANGATARPADDFGD